ncbi:MAG TPA: outer membrane beta-barrel protein, partial [Bacteroidales bacterium]|nr:outer membrane beta-barrel protein [Bacteroidales bacterium]
MKFNQICIALIIFSFWAISGHGQIKFGIRGGLNTTEVSPNSLLITNRSEVNEFKLDLEQARYGYHLGLFLQANSQFLFIQPEVWFRSSSAEFLVEDVQNGMGSEKFTERYQYIDIPVQLGMRLGPVR